jgi:hypothetical protein
MAQIQKPNPKNFATIGKLKEIIAQNNIDKKYIEDKRKAYGTDMGSPDESDIKDQIRLAQIADQNKRYGALIEKANKEAAAKAKNMVPVGRLKQIADSLENKGQLKMGAGDMRWEMDKNMPGAQRMYAEGRIDLDRADRYRGLANKAIRESGSKSKK